MILEQTPSTSITASVPDNYLTLTGYSSPSAKIELESATTYALTFSDSDGYFIFDNLLLPKNSNELCLTATDQSLRQSTPLCLPPISGASLNTNVGPVLLPPTITLDSAQVDAYSTTYVSGESIPNSSISIHLYQAQDKASLLVKPVEAFSFPNLSTQSDKNGNYSFSVPTTHSSNFRLFSSANFENNTSPKSNTLNYRLPSQFSITTILLFSLSLITVILFIVLITIFYRQKKSCPKKITINH